MKKIRCAIYTRKSAEEGLEQEFNSLDAQREACAAYVASQKAEGWCCCQLPTRTRGSREEPWSTRAYSACSPTSMRSRRADRGLQGRPADPFPLRLAKLVERLEAVLPPLSVGEMTLRRYGALNYSKIALVTFAAR